jgi:hypothetical protein
MFFLEFTQWIEKIDDDFESSKDILHPGQRDFVQIRRFCLQALMAHVDVLLGSASSNL